MALSDIFIKILISITFGAILGLESETREIEKKGLEQAEKEETQKIGGLRTYTIISLFGGINGILYVLNHKELALIFTIGLFLLIISAYVLNVNIKHAFGMTTEIAILITYIIGFFTTSSLIPIEAILAILVLLSFFLSQKRGIGKLISNFEHREVIDVIKFGLVALVILPILPNKDLLLSDIFSLLRIEGLDYEALSRVSIFNPFQIWAIVVIISGINIGGYLLSKVIGEKYGLFFTSIFSGFVSSTSALISFAGRSKKFLNEKRLAAGALISNSTSFILASLLILVTSKPLFTEVIPFYISMFIGGFTIGVIIYFFFATQSDEKDTHKIEYMPFSISPALKFVLMIIGLRLFVQFLQGLNVSPDLVVIFTAVSGLTGVDAPMIAIASLFAGGTINIQSAVFAVVLTNIINYIAKIFYAFTIGSRKFFKIYALGLIITGIIGVIAISIF